MKQKDVFIDVEVDAWYERNHQALQRKVFDLSDPVIQSVSNISKQLEYANKEIKVLKICHGEASRLAWFAEHLGGNVYGLNPSSKAVQVALKKGVHVEHG
jgi:hypothetical protein